MFCFFLMIRLPPRSTLTDTLFPYTTLFRSAFDRILGDLDRRDHRVGDRHGAQGQLIPFGAGVDDAMIEMGTKRREPAKEIEDIRSRLDHLQSRIGGEDGDAGGIGQRSEERRVGKECGSQGKTRRSPYS